MSDMSDNRLDSLFTPWKIGSCEIKNRIVLTSMGGTDLFGWMEKNRFIMEVAKNNVGLVLPGCQPVWNPMFGQWLHKNRKMYKDLAAWMPAFHSTGAKLFVQLTAGFGRSFPVSPMMEMLYNTPVIRTLSKPVMNLDKITAAPSPRPNRWSDRLPSREITRKEILDIVTSFAESSYLLKEAGVDGVEVHAVHEGYLLDQFTLPYLNDRSDEYGGSFENRYRFAVEIVKAIKAKCGDDFPVSLRYSVRSMTKGLRQGALPGEDFKEAGRDMAESEKAAKYLQDAGYDMLNCDNGTYDAWYWAHPPIYMPENCNLADVEHIKAFVDIPVVAAGRLDPYVAADEIKAGRLDAAGFARPFLADQAWVTKLKEGREDEIRPCILCHNGCFNMCHYEGVPNEQDLFDSLNMARCAVNAETMQWKKHYIKRTDKPKSVAIIGGGIGGMEAARVLALRGHRPVIYEKSDRLGGTFIPASAESYKGKLRQLLAWYIHQMEVLKVTVHLGVEVKDVGSLKEDIVIAATGAKAKKLPVKGFEKTIEACDYLNGTQVKERVVVIGGGLTGCEIAYELALQGHSVEIVEMKDDLVAQKGVCLANSSYLREWFAWKKVPVHLKARVEEIGDDFVAFRTPDGKVTRIGCDSVISSVGYEPSPIAGVPKARLIGDCLGVGNLRSVIWRAYEVAMKV